MNNPILTKKRKAAVLIFTYMVLTSLLIIGASYSSRLITELHSSRRFLNREKALWAAEAGVSDAIVQLKDDYNDLSYVSGTLPGEEYLSSSIDSLSDGKRKITVTGYAPSSSSADKVERTIEVTMNKYIPPGFYDNSIYAAGDLVRKGNVNGKVIYGGTASGSYNDPQPSSETQDPSISPLALLNFNQLRALSNVQGNYHDADHLNGPFPTSFWYTSADDGIDNDGDGSTDEADEWIPNVVFLEGNFILKGNDPVGGFFVVGGETIYDSTIAGTVGIDGCIYTRGDFTIKGGGGADINVSGIWAGGTTTLGGSSVITYNQDYMNGIKNLGIDADVQVTSWREL